MPRMPVTRTRWIGLLFLLGLLFFAFQGGEYSTGQWLEMRRMERVERERVAELRLENDSLAREARLVETDPATQERIAREEYGMLRKGEHAYILVPADSGRQ